MYFQNILFCYFIFFLSKFDYLLKLDDDIYLNLEKLHQIIDENQDPYLLLGTAICNDRPFRKKNHKWYISHKMYRHERYPPFLQGTAYLMTRQTALMIWKYALKTPLFPLEDVFITGILPKLAGLEPKRSSTFYDTHNGRKIPEKCNQLMKSSQCFCSQFKEKKTV